MTDIEFLEPTPASVPTVYAPDAATAPASIWRARVIAAAPPTLYLIAAALAFAAPFRTLYRMRIHAFSFAQVQQTDGWGRFSHNDLPFAEHDPRYGVLSCVAAGLFLLCAGCITARTVLVSRGVGGAARRFPFAGIAFVTGVAATAVVAATLGSALLAVQSVSNNVNAQLAAPTDDQVVTNSPAVTSAAFTLGGMVWLSLAAVVVGLLATLVTGWQRRHFTSETHSDGPDDEYRPPVIGHEALGEPDDEVLT